MAARVDARLTAPGALHGRRVAITGAAGFIGTHLADRLVAGGAAVLCLGPGPRTEGPAPGRLEPGTAVWLDVEPGAGAALTYALAACDSVVHLGYRPPRAGSGDPLEEERARNLPPTAELLAAAAAAGIAQVCFASSTSVYAPEIGIDESAPVAATTAYAEVKLEQEALIGDWAARTGRPATILRLSTVYGPREPARRAIPAFIQSALAGAPPVVAGRGQGPFDPVYVGDAVEAFALALAAGASGVFNIGTGVPRAPIEVARAVVRTVGRRLPVVCGWWAEDRRRPVCDPGRARAVLGFRPGTPLEAGLRAEVEWARATA